MPPDAIPTFDEWVSYCFTQGQADFAAYTTDEAAEARHHRFIDDIPDVALAEYAVRLFSDPTQHLRAVQDDDLAAGIWFVFGVGSEYFLFMRSERVPAELQIEVYRALRTMYVEFFDKVCRRSTRFNTLHPYNFSALETAVYMIWDMDCVEGSAMFPEQHPHLVEPALAVLEAALFECESDACQFGALHGLGHLQDVHPERVAAVVDRFLDANPKLHKELRIYAQNARIGMVQ